MKSEFLADLLVVAQTLSHSMTVLALVIGIWALLLFRLKESLFRWIALYYLFSSAANLLSNIFLWWRKSTMINVPASVHLILSLILFGLIYADQLSVRLKKSILLIASVGAFFGLANLFWWQGSARNSYTAALSGALALAYSIMYFFRVMQSLPAEKIYQVPMFWFNTSFLLYNGSTLLQFLFSDYLAEISWEILAMFVIFHNTVSVISMLLILIGLRYASRQIDLPQNRVA